MKHDARRRMNGQRVGLRNRMCHRNELDAKGAKLDPAARGHHRDRNFRRITLGGAFGLEQCGSELGGKNRAFQPWPEVDDGAEMILVRMRQHETGQVFALLFQKADVGHDRVDPWKMLLIAKGDPEIDREPGALTTSTKAVDRQIHADLAHTADARKDQFVRLCHLISPSGSGAAEMNVTRGNRNPLAGRGSNDHATRAIDGVESAGYRCIAGMDRHRLSESRRERQPAPADFAEPTPLLPNPAEFGPAIR